MNLSIPIEKVPRISSVYCQRLKRLNIKTLADLLYHFPRRYEDFSVIIPINQIKLNKTACIKGKILEIENTQTFKRRVVLTKAVIQDKSGNIEVVWFNQPYLTQNLNKNDQVCLAGKVIWGKKGIYLSNPIYEKLSPKPLIHTGRIVPIYPETEGVSSRWFRYILYPLLSKLSLKTPEIIPFRVLKKERLFPAKKALQQIHFPDSAETSAKARKRFSFEELFLLELMVLREKVKIQQGKGVPIPINLGLVKRFINSLPFKLTKAQKRATWEILKDLEKPIPMSRLLQGDVGSGKTIVAAIAGLSTAKAGFQATLMAPTEILAKQHFQEISERLKEFGLNIGLLTSKEAKMLLPKTKKIEKITKRKLLMQLKENKSIILIGTHALIQKTVKFGNLALVIVDEQHRFGVRQRARLIQQTTTPHLLTMTATPIPRSLALSVYADLDLSFIDELPIGRKKIVTKIVPPNKRQETYKFVKDQAKQGKQAFIICPRIEMDSKSGEEAEIKSGWDEVKTVKEEYERLSKTVFPNLKITMLHGKMKPGQKEKIMKDLKDKKIDILVSTSVVEVGIDVPDATAIIIEGAEMFGLTQLHQFRGRVGRSEFQSFCFLFTNSSNKKAFQRLRALVESENGFELAEKDLKIRGPGDFLGVRQSGLPDLTMASLKNIRMVEKTRQAAKQILQESPDLKKYPQLKKRVKEFKQKIHLE